MTRPRAEASRAAGRALLVRARWILLPEGGWRTGAALLVWRGRIQRCAASAPALGRLGDAQPLDLGDVALAPGYVNAHAHLELSGMEGALPGTSTFADWIRALLRARTDTARAPSPDHVRRGADRLLASGTTLVGDIDSSGAGDEGLRGHPLRVLRYREVLDAGDPARAAGALARLAAPRARAARRYQGISPHAPYTLSDELVSGLGRRLARSRIPLAIHWAETREEVEWLLHGRGPLGAILAHRPRAGGLDLLLRAGLVGPRTALVHANHPGAGDFDRVARARASIVHCPGTHEFFGREPFDPAPWFDRGVSVALGTDSLASNAALDMGREMALFRRARPGVPPARVLAMATVDGARALGFEGRAGRLAAGCHADFVLHEVRARRPEDVNEALTTQASTIRAVWIGGRQALPLGTGGSNPHVC